jgi:hypothetical protein
MFSVNTHLCVVNVLYQQVGAIYVLYKQARAVSVLYQHICGYRWVDYIMKCICYQTTWSLSNEWANGNRVRKEVIFNRNTRHVIMNARKQW